MTFATLRRLGYIALATVLSAPLGLHAQQPASQKPPTTPSATTDQEPLETLKIDVSVVNLFFNVKDSRGALVPGLGKDAFRVLEDGRPQTIKYFAAEVDQPLTLGILIDTSYSQDRVLPMEKDVGAAFLREVLRPKDLAFLISFDVNVDMLHDFTNSARELNSAMQTARINAGTGGGGLPGLGGGPVPISRPRGTLLYDAIYLAADEKLAKEVGRKAMIILTDGEDQGSRENIKDAIEAAQKSDSICYVLLIADRDFYSGMYGGDRAMRQLTEQTGGRLINVGKSEKKLKEAFDQIASELRTQYSIGYTPTNQTRDGSFRHVEIKPFQTGLKIQARAGYYSPLSR
jgi:VWFA-related protein